MEQELEQQSGQELGQQLEREDNIRRAPFFLSETKTKTISEQIFSGPCLVFYWIGMFYRFIDFIGLFVLSGLLVFIGFIGFYWNLLFGLLFVGTCMRIQKI